MAEPPRRFRPLPGTRGGHWQTLLGFVLRRRVPWSLPAEDVVVESEPDVRLLLRATWQPGPRAASPALLLVHGLGGSDASTYAVVAGRRAFARGWHVVRMNMRGAGESLVLCARLYNAGLDVDVVAALRAIAAQAPRCALLGFSLGANQTLLALARRPQELPGGLLGAVAVSPPLDLSACADSLERPGNRLYQWYFMHNLRRAYRERRGLRPDLFPAGADVGPRTIREWDDAITAPHGGFVGASHYYACSSAGPLLRNVRLPALIVSSEDDPMIPIASVRPHLAGLHDSVRVEITPTGGHVGFVHRLDGVHGFWAGERALDFLEALDG